MLQHVKQKGASDRLGVARVRVNLYIVFDCLGVARARDNLYRRKQCFTNSPGSKIQTKFSDETLYDKYLIHKIIKTKQVAGFNAYQTKGCVCFCWASRARDKLYIVFGCLGVARATNEVFYCRCVCFF